MKKNLGTVSANSFTERQDPFQQQNLILKATSSVFVKLPVRIKGFRSSSWKLIKLAVLKKFSLRNRIMTRRWIYEKAVAPREPEALQFLV